MSVREAFSLVKSSIRFLVVGLLFLAVVLFVCFLIVLGTAVKICWISWQMLWNNYILLCLIVNVCEQTFFSEQKEMRTFNKGSSSSFKGELRHPETLSWGKVICAELKRHYPKEKDARSGKSVQRGHTAAGTGEEWVRSNRGRQRQASRTLEAVWWSGLYPGNGKLRKSGEAIWL